jgi:hypothetical protein
VRLIWGGSAVSRRGDAARGLGRCMRGRCMSVELCVASLRCEWWYGVEAVLAATVSAAAATTRVCMARIMWAIVRLGGVCGVVGRAVQHARYGCGGRRRGGGCVRVRECWWWWCGVVTASAPAWLRRGVGGGDGGPAWRVTYAWAMCGARGVDVAVWLGMI